MALLKARSRRPAGPPAPADGATGAAGLPVPTGTSSTSGTPDTGRGVRATWWFTISSVVFYSGVMSVTSGLLMLAGGEYGLQVLDVVVIVLSVMAAAALIRYCWFFRTGLGGGLPARAYTLWLVSPAVALYALGLLQPHTLWVGALPLWLAANALAVVVSRAARVRILLAGLAALGLHGLLALLVGRTAAGEFWEAGGATTLVVYALMTPVLFVAGIWWWDIVVRLDDSRRTSGELAVAKERLRFAADLHDIQGHHLQVIALKTELAGRLLDTDPAAARVQITEAQGLARTALEDTRALVHGYRAVSLAVEAANAADVLGAAGIECSVDVRADGLPPAERTLFGLVIREATTNILRHSEATGVELVLTRVDGGFELTVRNDGVVASATRSSGSGIDGLRHRFEAVGGAVHARLDGEHFTLSATVPAGSTASAAATVPESATGPGAPKSAAESAAAPARGGSA